MHTWRDGPWTLPQRRVVAGFIAVVLLILSYRAFTRPTYVANPLPARGPRAAELVSRLDPNVATWEQLALLPNLGETRARAVVAYREQFQLDHPNERAFQQPEDLENIKGIGEGTVANLREYLDFPTDPGH